MCSPKAILALSAAKRNQPGITKPFLWSVGRIKSALVPATYHHIHNPGNAAHALSNPTIPPNLASQHLKYSQHLSRMPHLAVQITYWP